MPFKPIISEQNNIKTDWKLPKIRSCTFSIEYDEFVYSEKENEQ
jgi:hypothetical protein